MRRLGRGAHDLGMSLGHAVFISRIVGRTIDRPEVALAAHAALQFSLDLGAAMLLKRIRAAHEKEAGDQRKKNRTALHLPILWKSSSDARRQG